MCFQLHCFDKFVKSHIGPDIGRGQDMPTGLSDCVRHRNVEIESEWFVRVTYPHDISGIPVNQTRGQPFLTYISRCPTKTKSVT